MPRTSQPGRSVSSRLLDLLFAFEPGETELSLAELARKAGLPHATARRLVLELERAGALKRHANGRFTVGIRLWQLGALAPMTESLRAMALRYMEDLHAALQQHVQLAILEGTEAVIIERLSTPHAVGPVSHAGGRLPLHCTGVGKVLLSHGGEDLERKILAGELRRYTSGTITRPDALRRDLAECRRTGTALVRGELTEGADSIATRIVNSEGRVVAAISVVVRQGSVQPREVVPAVITSGLAVSRALGWRPGTRLRDT